MAEPGAHAAESNAEDEMSNAAEQAKRIIARTKKAKATKRKWNWGTQRQPGGYVHECEYLSETSIVLNQTYENSEEDYAFVAEACQSAPAVAKAYLALRDRCKAAGVELA
jgi:hypothetical protein